MDSERIQDAAIQAEFDTGRREESVAEAKAHIAVRLARMASGTVVLLIGIVMIPLPGPGWVVVAAGLSILAVDVAWAERLLRQVRRRIPGIPEDGKVPRSTLLVGAVLMLAGIAASLWWYGR